MSGIDDIVEMVLKEARERDKGNLFVSLYDVLEEINRKAVNIIVDDMIQERSREHD